ncbi:MAG: hypothetical protein Q4P07_00040 [Ornithinimicrobium sp.]|uniref:hypothetical protein n=1 Tax=Ornithinimicrobium sp. TaxID=1977084 RepID=UPI0026DF3CD1|nr:hypothetical protein [Ornithinimicrobium sp.]MDO5738518.1 hypothetical protein [Ornithinimicrobium sp.]
MANTFNAVPDAPTQRSTAFLAIDQPRERLEQIIEEAHLHRGSLREQDGYTIPFREGGSVRIRAQGAEDAVASGAPTEVSGLHFAVSAPTDERRAHIQQVMGEQVVSQLGNDGLDWQSEA